MPVTNTICRGKGKSEKREGGRSLDLGWICFLCDALMFLCTIVSGRWSMVRRDKEDAKGWICCVVHGQVNTRVKLCVCVVWLLLECVGNAGNANELRWRWE